MLKKWRCPKHGILLRTVEDYPSALVHDGCPEIFTLIDNHLCILNGNQWKDVKTQEVRIPPPEKPIAFNQSSDTK